MRRLSLSLALLGALVGCESSGQGAPDAANAVDAAPIDASRMPFTTTGTTPAGSLDDVRFISVDYLTGFCQPGYYVGLHQTNEDSRDAVAIVFIPMPDELTEPLTGTIAASARLGSDSTQSTDQVSFEVAHADLPSTEPFRIAGRVTASTGGWSLDFTFDARTTAFTCI